MEPYNSKARKRKALRTNAGDDDTSDEDGLETREIVSSTNEHDILLGRGAPTAYYRGNVSFRDLVSSRKGEYMASSRHKRKQEIAKEIFDEIEARGGRFLSKVETVTLNERHAALGLEEGQKAWYVASKPSTMEKIKQALRDGESAEAAMEAAAAAAPIPAPPPMGVLPSSRHEPAAFASVTGGAWNPMGSSSQPAAASDVAALELLLRQDEHNRRRAQLEALAFQRHQQQQQQQQMGAMDPSNHAALSLLLRQSSGGGGSSSGAFGQSDLATLLLQQQEEHEAQLQHRQMVRLREHLELERLEQEQRLNPLSFGETQRSPGAASHDALLALAMRQQQQHQQSANRGASSVAHLDPSNSMLREQLSGLHSMPQAGVSRQSHFPSNQPLSLLLLEEERNRLRSQQNQQRFQQELLTSQRLEQLLTPGHVRGDDLVAQMLQNASYRPEQLREPLNDRFVELLRQQQVSASVNNAAPAAALSFPEQSSTFHMNAPHNAADLAAAVMMRRQQLGDIPANDAGLSGANTSGALLLHDPSGTNNNDSLVTALLSQHAVNLSSEHAYRSAESAATRLRDATGAHSEAPRGDDSTRSEESDAKPRARETVHPPLSSPESSAS